MAPWPLCVLTWYDKVRPPYQVFAELFQAMNFNYAHRRGLKNSLSQSFFLKLKQIYLDGCLNLMTGKSEGRMMRLLTMLLSFLFVPMIFGVPRIPFMAVSPMVDGNAEAGEWQDAMTFDSYYQTSPGDNSMPSESTVFKIGHDEKNIYVLALCEYKNVADMRLFHCGRDNINTDRVVLYFDTFNTKDKAYFFASNGYGEQADGIVSAYNRHDISSDIYFISESSTGPSGYVVEFAIPLKSIKYSGGEGPEWGLLFRRYLVKNGEEISNHILTRADSNYFNNYGTYSFANLPSEVNFTVEPSLTGAVSSDREDVSGFEERSDTLNAEINIFYEPNSSVTFTGTLNPDYSTIEADAYQIDVNNRYPLYYGEKRPFFIEETNPFAADINIYHTRNIVNPMWGLKCSYNKGDVGIFAMSSEDEDIPAERFGYYGDSGDVMWNFISVKKRVNTDSDYRFALASREFDAKWNNVASLDSNLFFDSGFHTHNQVAGSLTDLDDSDAAPDIAYSSSTSFDDEKWHFEIMANGAGPDFYADMGFIREKGVRTYGTINRMLIMSYSDTAFFRFADFSISGYAKYDWDHSDRLSINTQPYISMGFKHNLNLWVGMLQEMEDYLGDEYHVYSYTARVSSDTFSALSGFVRYTSGRGLWYDTYAPEVRAYRNVESGVTFRPGKSIDLACGLEWVDMDGKFEALSFQSSLKLQFHKNFWMRLDAHNMKVRFKDNGSERVNTLFYPLFVYQPRAGISLYAGIQDSNERFTLTEETSNMDTARYFMKISYSLDLR